MNAQSRSWGTKLAAVLAGASILGAGAQFAAPVAAQEAQITAEAMPEVAAEKLAVAEDTVEQFIVYYFNDRSDLVEGDVVEVIEVDGIEYELSMVRENALGGTILSVGEPVGKDVADAIVNAISSYEDVEFVEADQLAITFGESVNDPLFKDQWSLSGMNSIDVTDVWGHVGGEQVVAVLDSGIYRHSDLRNNLVGGYDFVSNAANSRDGDGRDNDPTDPGNWVTSNDCRGDRTANSTWHGTMVAGVLGAEHNNGTGTAGAANNVKVQPIRVLSPCGGATSDIADAIIWASGGEVDGVPANPTPASVINLSLGGYGTCDRTYQRAINIATDNGATVVVAADNASQDANHISPGNCDNVINVAATDVNGKLASYTNRGGAITLSAPGGDYSTGPIMTTGNSGTKGPEGDKAARFVGTSAAAPAVAGGVAMLKSIDPSLTTADIADILTASATPMPGQSGAGAGLLNMRAAYKELTGEDCGSTNTQQARVEEVADSAPEASVVKVATDKIEFTNEDVQAVGTVAAKTGQGGFFAMIINFLKALFGM